MERLTKTYKDGTHGASDNLPCGENSYDYKSLLLEKLGKYEDLEERLNKVYGDCDGLLESMIELLEEHSGVDIPDDTVKALLLTNKAVDFYKECEDLDVQDRLIKLPCKVGDTVYVDNTILPIEDMECYEDIDNKIPLYFPARVVSFHFAKRNWMKIAVKTKWLHEWIDDETGPESDYIECEKNFTILLSMIDKTVFLTKSEAEAIERQQ